jgi:hypothetical protein
MLFHCSRIASIFPRDAFTSIAVVYPSAGNDPEARSEMPFCLLHPGPETDKPPFPGAVKSLLVGRIHRFSRRL